MNGEAVGFLAWFIPLCTFASAALVAAINMRPAHKAADEAAKDGQWSRMAEWCDRLEKRLVIVEAELATCHAERNAAVAEIARRDARDLGLGQARQQAAEIVAGDRFADQQAKEVEKRSGE